MHILAVNKYNTQTNRPRKCAALDNNKKIGEITVICFAIETHIVYSVHVCINWVVRRVNNIADGYEGDDAYEKRIGNACSTNSEVYEGQQHWPITVVNMIFGLVVMMAIIFHSLQILKILFHLLCIKAEKHVSILVAFWFSVFGAGFFCSLSIVVLRFSRLIQSMMRSLFNNLCQNSKHDGNGFIGTQRESSCIELNLMQREQNHVTYCQTYKMPFITFVRCHIVNRDISEYSMQFLFSSTIHVRYSGKISCALLLLYSWDID